MTSADSSQPLVAAADGSALGNPGPAGWAWYVDDAMWRAGGWPHGTNNMGELRAVLDLFESTASFPERELRILCDSQYVINCITKWMPGWKRNGWRKKDKKPVLNRDLLESLDAALVGRKYSFEWVKGHAGHPLNEAADDRARAAATAFRDGTPPDEGPGAGTLSGRAEFAATDTGKDASGTRAPEAAAPAGGPASSREEAGGMPDDAADRSEGEANAESESTDPAGAESATTTAAEGAAWNDATAEELVLDLEQGLAQEGTFEDSEALAELLAEDLIWITARGRTAGKDAALKYPRQAFGLEEEPEILSCAAHGRVVVQVLSRVQSARGRLLRSSLWTRSESTGWVLSLRQDTPVQ